ncbi:MAG: terminase [Eggerthellaceae bacterium]|nr:terminase [Eggerthellaceae bacterium]
MEGAGGEWWMKGGRGSTKSSFISICIVLLVITFPWANAVVVRRFGNTLRDSVYSQILWAISELGLGSYFKATASPMQITYKPTGQRIVFRGMDDPLKAKGVKFEKGYCAIIWFEELDQFANWEVIRSALKSFKRGGSVFWTFYSYNPPKTLWSWVNRQALEMGRKPGCVVNHSTYLDVMEAGHADWLGDPFIEDAEWLRDTNEQAYRWEMLGEITGTGGNVFDNIIDRPVTDAEIATFERPRNGVDWGWFPDPWRFVRGEYQPGAKRLILFDEHSANRTLPEDTGKVIVDALTYPDKPGDEPRFHRQRIWYDDTPDGKAQGAVYRRKLGLDARPAAKGGMRELSYQMLAGLREIVIDPVRCPLTFEEFKLKEYDKDRDGNWIEGIPDGNDHSIDAVRYMMMKDFRRAA